MKKQIGIVITIFIIGILIGCGMMSIILKPNPESTTQKEQTTIQEKTEKVEDNCIKIETTGPTSTENKVLPLDDNIKDLSLIPQNKEDMYEIIGLSNNSLMVSKDILGIMYSEREIDDIIALYITNRIFEISLENNYDQVMDYHQEKLSIKKETLEKLGKEIYKDFIIPEDYIESNYKNVYNLECSETTCEFEWEIWGYTGPNRSHYINNVISENKIGQNTIIKVEILYNEIDIIEKEEALENSTIRKRHDSTEKKNIGVQYENHNFAYYKKHLSNTEKYQYTFDQNNCLINIKRVN